MAIVEPQEAIHTSEIISGKLKITIPVQKQWGRIIWFSLCFVINTILLINIGKLFGSLLLFSSGENGLGINSTYPLTVAAMGLLPIVIFSITEILVIYALFWRLFGAEIVTIDKEKLTLTREILSWQRTKTYLLNSVATVRIAQATDNWISTFSGFQKLLGLTGTISFDYGAKAYLFGNELDQAEARQIIAKIENWLGNDEAAQPNPT